MFWVTYYWADFENTPGLGKKLRGLTKRALTDQLTLSSPSPLGDRRNVDTGITTTVHPTGGTSEELVLCHVLDHTTKQQQAQAAARCADRANARRGEAFGPNENVVARLRAQSVAEQLTLLNHKLLTRIHPVEYVLYYFPGVGEKPADKAPNLEAAIKRFDLESYWVVAEILLPTKAKDQASLITKFIRVAEHCVKLGNFFSLFSVLGALCFPEVTRLRAAWEKVCV